MKVGHWIALAAAAGAGYVLYTRKQHPVIGGPGYPMHQTTFGEAAKIAFLGARYPEPITVPAGAAVSLTPVVQGVSGVAAPQTYGPGGIFTNPSVR